MNSFLKYVSLLLPLIALPFTSQAFEKHPDNYDESIIKSPLKDKNEQALEASGCRYRPHNLWEICYTFNADDTSKNEVNSFNFTNPGDNRIVERMGTYVSRQFRFQFEDFARSDLGLLLIDSPDAEESHVHYAMYMFFPRTVIPAVRLENDLLVVTLPTNEEVFFDPKTKEIVGGVLEELPMQIDTNGNAKKPQLIYKGKGVMLSANRLHDYPVGDTYSAGRYRKATNVATVVNAQQKTCKIPVKDLWYTDYNKGGSVYFNAQLATDSAVRKSLKSKCGMSF